MKLNKPKIFISENKKISEAFVEKEFLNYRFCENEVGKLVISNVIIDSCIFEKIDFNNIEFDEVELIDIIFDGCDLSNKTFHNKMLSRVLLKH